MRVSTKTKVALIFSLVIVLLTLIAAFGSSESSLIHHQQTNDDDGVGGHYFNNNNVQEGSSTRSSTSSTLSTAPIHGSSSSGRSSVVAEPKSTKEVANKKTDRTKRTEVKDDPSWQDPDRVEIYLHQLQQLRKRYFALSTQIQETEARKKKFFQRQGASPGGDIFGAADPATRAVVHLKEQLQEVKEQMKNLVLEKKLPPSSVEMVTLSPGFSSKPVVESLHPSPPPPAVPAMNSDSGEFITTATEHSEEDEIARRRRRGLDFKKFLEERFKRQGSITGSDGEGHRDRGHDEPRNEHDTDRGEVAMESHSPPAEAKTLHSLLQEERRMDKVRGASSPFLLPGAVPALQGRGRRRRGGRGGGSPNPGAENEGPIYNNGGQVVSEEESDHRRSYRRKRRNLLDERVGGSALHPTLTLESPGIEVTDPTLYIGDPNRNPFNLTFEVDGAPSGKHLVVIPFASRRPLPGMDFWTAMSNHYGGTNRCAGSNFIFGCTCRGALRGSACGNDDQSVGRRRCEGGTNGANDEACSAAIFRPLPRGFPRHYPELVSNRSKFHFEPFHHQEEEDFHVGANTNTPAGIQHKDRSTVEGAAASTEQRRSQEEFTNEARKKLKTKPQLNPKLRTRNDGAEVHLYCNTGHFQGVTNQEFTFAQCALLGYHLNASRVHLMQMHRHDDAKVGEVFDLDHLQRKGEEHGFEIRAIVPEEVPHCMPVHGRREDFNGLLAGRNYPECCGISQYVFDGEADPAALDAFSYHEVKDWKDLGPGFRNLKMVEDPIRQLAAEGRLTGRHHDNWDCSKKTPIFLSTYAYNFGGNMMYRVGESLPTSDFFTPSAKIRTIVDQAIVRMKNQDQGCVGGGGRSSSSGHRFRGLGKGIAHPPLQPTGDFNLHQPSGSTASNNNSMVTPPWLTTVLPALPLPLAKYGGNRSAGDLASNTSTSTSSTLQEEDYQEAILAFKMEQRNVPCDFIGVHLRYESDAVAAWRDTVGSLNRYHLLRRIDQLAESLNCPRVVVNGKPLNRQRKADTDFLATTFAKFYNTGGSESLGETGVPPDNIDGIFGDSLLGIPSLGRQLADRHLITQASVAVIWDPFTGVSSFSHRIFDLRCRRDVGSGNNTTASDLNTNILNRRRRLTFSYSLPYDGDLIPEC